MLVLAVALGGALGAVARYGSGSWLYRIAGPGFPWGTLAVNVLGSLLIGLTFRYVEASAVAPEVRAFVTVGFLGAFTTFSAYSLETITLLRAGAWGRAALYSGGSVVLGLAAVALGMALAGHLMRGRF